MSDSIPVEVQRELRQYKQIVDDLMSKVLSGDKAVSVVDIHKEIVAHQTRINAIMERWKNS